MHARAWVVRRTAEEGALASFDDTPHPTHRAGVQEEPEPFALVPAHAQLLTCCDFDAAGTRLLCGDAAGQVFLYTVPPGAPSSSSLLHRCAVAPLHLYYRAPLRTSAPSAPLRPASARHLGPAPPPPAPSPPPPPPPPPP